LPFFLAAAGHEAPPQEVLAGLQLTAHFLDQWVLAPHGRILPEARQRLTEMAARTLRESA
jgi:hypothetical protein